MVAFAWFFLLVCVFTAGVLFSRRLRLSFPGSTLLGFLLLTFGMTSPLPLYLTRMMLGSGAGEDAFIGIWNLWWTRTAAAAHLNPLTCNWVFYPNGTSLVLHTFAFTYGAASLPLQWLASLLVTGSGPAGPGASVPEVDALCLVYNTILIASFTLSGYFTYRLAFLESGHRTASLLAGIFFAFTNYRFANTVRLHVVATELLVLSAWAWSAWLRKPSLARLFGWAGASVLLVYASLEYAAFSLLLFAILGLPYLNAWRHRHPQEPEHRPEGSRTAWPRAGGIAPRTRDRMSTGPRAPGGVRKDMGTVVRPLLGTVVAAGLAGILLYPLLAQLVQRTVEGGYGFDPRLTQFFSADLLDFFLPNPRHPIWGSWPAAITAGFHRGDGGFGLSLGWFGIVLAVIGAVGVHRSHKGRVWFWGWIVFLILALGPRLHIGGHVLDGIPLPQAILSRLLPFLAGSRAPIRYAAPAELCMAVTIACGWAALRRRRGFMDHNRPARIEIAAGGLLLFGALAAPLPMVEVPVPNVYESVTGAPGSSALIHIPGIPAREDLLYQTVHRQRLVENLETAIPLRSRRGPDPFRDPRWTALTRSLGTPGWVASMSEGQRGTLVADLRSFLRQLRIRWIVLLRSRERLAPDARSFDSELVLDRATYEAFLANLRLLGPVREEDFNTSTLFEFDVPGIASIQAPVRVQPGAPWH
jgi:hypothetical protein